jgi:hypothetical protein
MQGIPLIKSKTFWFNVLSIVVMFAGIFGFDSFKPDPKWLEIAGAIAGLVNIIIRLVFTNQPVTSLT